MPFCTYCGQSFTRDEHLERHILTHTNVKPYKCFSCHMSFARRDLLHRHYTVHGRDGNQEPLQPSNGIIPKSAGRTPIACSNCAKTKTKCDKKFPCTRCATRNLKCTVRPTRRTTKNTARLIEQAAAVQNGQQAEEGASDRAQPGAAAASSSSSSSSSDGSHSPEVASREPVAATRTSASLSGPSSDASNANSSANSSVSSATSAAPSVEEPKAAALELNTKASDVGKGASSAVHLAQSPAPTTASAFLNATPLSAYDEFLHTSASREDSEHAASASPRYMIEWPSQPQLTYPFESVPRQDILMSTPVPFEAMSMGAVVPPPHTAHPDNLSYPSPFNQPMPELSAQMSAPSMEQTFMPHMPLEHPSASYRASRQSSMSIPSVTDFEAITIAEDAWSVFRCTPCLPSSACPRTAALNLERLERSLKNHERWRNWRPSWDDADKALGDQLEVVSIEEMPRDKLLAITQTFLHKALEIHQDESGRRSPEADFPSGHVSNFVILPPARVLEYFLRSYANGFERFYPLTAKGTLNTNELMTGPNDRASSLLLLLMIGQGALITPTVDGRWLTGGLTEACRISLFDLIEKNIMMSGEPVVLHSALLFTVQAAWSGDKWQMDIAMGQRGMYFSMLRHSGFLDAKIPTTTTIHQRSNIDALWQEWVQQELRSRLVYSWVMIDQDLSLFHDQTPMFSVTEFGMPMPDADGLWHAKSAREWSQIFEQVHEFSGGYSSVGSGARPLCLRDLFRLFLDDTIVPQNVELTPLQLRLLLHPLQSLVCQFRQLLSCFSDTSGFRMGSKSVTAASTKVRLEEVQAMLQRWYSLADRYMNSNPLCPLMQANLVMFHLVSLNAVTDFQEIERLARREGIDGSYQQLQWMHKQCVTDVEEAIFHSGQILRLVRTMPRSIRPPWWAAAIYRVALILWCDSLVQADALTPTSGLFPMPDSTLAVDNLLPGHPAVVRYLTKREGKPMLTKRDGSLMSIDNPFAVLFFCVDVIGEGVSTRFSDGLSHKLTRLAKS